VTPRPQPQMSSLYARNGLWLKADLHALKYVAPEHAQCSLAPGSPFCEPRTAAAARSSARCTAKRIVDTNEAAGLW
jgi:hypothetical protein